jgi:hypothetical protein
MALTNHERVGKALDLLRDGLRPFVEREMAAHRGPAWASTVRDVLSDTRLATGKGDPLQDVNVLLVLMDRTWNEVFRDTLGKARPSGASSTSCWLPGTGGRTRSPSPRTTPTGRSTRRDGS